MRPDPPDIGKPRRISAETYARDGSRRVGSVLHASWADAGRVTEISATIGGCGMDMYNRVAAIEFFHDRPECRIAEPRIVIACEEPDTIGLQRVIGVGDLFQGRIDVRQWHRREE